MVTSRHFGACPPQTAADERLAGGTLKRRYLFLLGSLASAPVLFAPAPPISAATSKSPNYVGPAPGSVACEFQAKVSFSPPLTTSAGSKRPSKIKGDRLLCIASDSAVEIKSGTITGSFATGFGTGCTWNGNQSATLTIDWNARVDGDIGGSTYGGKAKLTPSVVTYSREQLVTSSGGDDEGFAFPGNASSSSVTGSFASTSADDRSATAYSTLTPAALTAACSEPGGLKSLTLTGTMTLGAGVVDPTSITSGPDGALWFTNFLGTGRITTAGTISNFTDPAITFPANIIAGPDGALWFTDLLTNSVDRLTTSGSLTTYTDPSISFPEGITVGPDGALWFTNDGNNSIGRITTSGAVSSFVDPSVDADPTNITVGPDGDLWFTNSGSNSIGQMTTSGAVTLYYSLSINGPEGITSGPDGALWYTNSGNNSIGRITTAGVATSYTDPSISFPGGITTGPDGALWFTNGASLNDSSDTTRPGSIGRITTAGVVSNYIDPSLSDPTDITSGPDGALWFTDGEGLPALLPGISPPTGISAIGRITTAGVFTSYG